MGFDLHTIGMPQGAGPQIQDRLVVASVLNVFFPAAAKGVGAVGSVTAGSAYTFTPTITPTGGTVQAASAAGVAPVVAAGWQALLRAVMKVVSAAVPAGGGGTGVVANDTFLFPFGIELTASTVVGGAVTVWTVTQAGAFTLPGGLPSVLVPLSTSGVGVGVSITPSWGIGSVAIDDSGNYSTLPTGYTVASVDGNGSGGALALGTPTIGAGAALFRAVYAGVQLAQPVLGASAFPPPPGYGFVGSVNQPTLDVVPVAKCNGYVAVAITPNLAANSVVAGTLDALIWA